MDWTDSRTGLGGRSLTTGANWASVKGQTDRLDCTLSFADEYANYMSHLVCPTKHQAAIGHQATGKC